MYITEYERYTHEIKVAFVRRVHNGKMTEQTYYRLAGKLNEWAKMAEGVNA